MYVVDYCSSTNYQGRACALPEQKVTNHVKFRCTFPEAIEHEVHYCVFQHKFQFLSARVLMRCDYISMRTFTGYLNPVSSGFVGNTQSPMLCNDILTW